MMLFCQAVGATPARLGDFTGGEYLEAAREGDQRYFLILVANTAERPFHSNRNESIGRPTPEQIRTMAELFAPGFPYTSGGVGTDLDKARMVIATAADSYRRPQGYFAYPLQTEEYPRAGSPPNRTLQLLRDAVAEYGRYCIMQFPEEVGTRIAENAGAENARRLADQLEKNGGFPKRFTESIRQPVVRPGHSEPFLQFPPNDIDSVPPGILITAALLAVIVILGTLLLVFVLYWKSR